MENKKDLLLIVDGGIMVCNNIFTYDEEKDSIVSGLMTNGVSVLYGQIIMQSR